MVICSPLFHRLANFFSYLAVNKVETKMRRVSKEGASELS